MRICSKNEYLLLLNFLSKFCNKVKIIETEDSIFLANIFDLSSGEDWTRKFPGQGKGNQFKVLEYPMSKKLISEFEKYGYFFEIDDGESDLGMAFYKDEKLVFWIVFHEELCILEDEYIKEYQIYLSKNSITRKKQP